MEHADCFENVRLVLSEGGEYPVPGENYIFYTLTINLIIIAIASFFFGLEPAMYTLVSMYVSSTVLDKVQQGFGSSKSVMIITGSEQQVADAILETLGRGVTYLEGEGAYTGNKKREWH